MQNIYGKDGGFVPIAPGPIDTNRGRKCQTDIILPKIKVYVIKTKLSTRKNTKISIKLN